MLEDNVFVGNFMDAHRGARKVEELKRWVKTGRIEIAPKWAGIFQGLPDGEVHTRNMVIGKRYPRMTWWTLWKRFLIQYRRS